MAKQITLTLTIDPAAAVRASKSQCGDITRTLTDEELASLTADQRDTLARHVAGEGTEGSHTDYSNTHWRTPLTAGVAIADTAITTIANLLDQRRSAALACLAENAAKKAAKQREWDDAVRAVLAEQPEYKVRNVTLTREGKESDYNTFLTVSAQRMRVVPHLRHVGFGDCAPELRAAYEAARKDAHAELAAQIESFLPLVRAKQAEIDTENARVKAEYAALYARLPAVLRARHAAGFASKDEITRELQKLIRSDAGFTGYKGWGASCTLRELSDKEFLAMQELQAKVPHDATIEPKEVWDTQYRPATDDDDSDEIDEDGEVAENINERRIFYVTWTRGGLETHAVVTMPASD